MAKHTAQMHCGQNGSYDGAHTSSSQCMHCSLLVYAALGLSLSIICKGCCKPGDLEKLLAVKSKTKEMMLAVAVAWQRLLPSEAQLNSCDKFVCKQLLLPDQVLSEQPVTRPSADMMVCFACVLTQALV